MVSLIGFAFVIVLIGIILITLIVLGFYWFRLRRIKKESPDSWKVNGITPDKIRLKGGLDYGKQNRDRGTQEEARGTPDGEDEEIRSIREQIRKLEAERGYSR